ncbi:unnamed protein product [Pleuronectes platessa]|uniref:Uncharacterized protein n=1 Tax=Pleuronectes platessa TaxID=8262 RepID=A0A9N7Z8D7_PLEPL|nr:unnamed protein product [Pleuronectes platessa]
MTLGNLAVKKESTLISSAARGENPCVCPCRCVFCPEYNRQQQGEHDTSAEEENDFSNNNNTKKNKNNETKMKARGGGRRRRRSCFGVYLKRRNLKPSLPLFFFFKSIFSPDCLDLTCLTEGREKPGHMDSLQRNELSTLRRSSSAVV